MKFNYFNADCNGDFKAKNFRRHLKIRYFKCFESCLTFLSFAELGFKAYFVSVILIKSVVTNKFQNI